MSDKRAKVTPEQEGKRLEAEDPVLKVEEVDEQGRVELCILVKAEYPSAAEAIAWAECRKLQGWGELAHYYGGGQADVLPMASNGTRWVVLPHSSECSCGKEV